MPERAVRRRFADPVARVEAARADLLAKHSRQDRQWLLRPIARRLKREGLTSSAATVAQVATDGAVVCYGRTRDEERALLKAVLNRLGALVGTFTPAESESVFALLRFVDAWSDEMTAAAARPVAPEVN
jgi:hypothetical protein